MKPTSNKKLFLYVVALTLAAFALMCLFTYFAQLAR